MQLAQETRDQFAAALEREAAHVADKLAEIRVAMDNALVVADKCLDPVAHLDASHPLHADYYGNN